MQRTCFSVSVVFLILLSTALLSYGAAYTTMSQRKVLQEDVCLSSLTSAENEEPSDAESAEASFLLGTCYLGQGNISGANLQFSKTVQLVPDYSKRIARAYKHTADSILAQGKTASLRRLYYKAVQFNPDLKKHVGQKLYAAGQDMGSERLLHLATLYDDTLREKVARYFQALSRESEGDESLTLLKTANRYGNGGYSEEIREKALTLCNSRTAPEDREECMVSNMQYLDDKSLFDSSLAYYTELWGEPEKVTLDNDEWVSIMQVREGDVIHHLSTETIWKKGEGSPDLMKPASLKPDSLTFDHAEMKDGGSLPLLFRKYKSDAATYLWIEKNIRNVDMKQRGLR